MAIVSDRGISRVVTKEKIKVASFQVSTIRGASFAYAPADIIIRFRRKTKEPSPRVWLAGDIYALSISLIEMLNLHDPCE